MKLYRSGVRIYGTVYVKANSLKEAREIIDEMAREDDLPDTFEGRFDSPDMPAVSLSPVMTLDRREGRVEEVT